MNPLPPLLGLLARGPQHGYQLKVRIDRELAPFWRLDYAQLYRALRRAAAQGAAKVRTEPSAQGPTRKRYTLTGAGRRQFAAWLHSPVKDLEEILVRLRLAHAAGAWDYALQTHLRTAFAGEHAACRARYQRACAGDDPAERVLAETAWHRAETLEHALQTCVMSVVPSTPPALTVIGSDDPLLARLGRSAGFLIDVRGSYGGLWALSRNEARVAALHLRDPDTQEYNVSFIRRLLPENDVLLINLAWRETGLLLPAGNPRRIRCIKDLARRGLRLANRQPTAGTRLLLRLQLRAAAIDPQRLRGWNDAQPSHAAVAEAVRDGAADVGPGLRATAESYGLDFLPLVCERFDLVVQRAFFESRAADRLRRALSSRRLQHDAAGLAGYDFSDSGQVICRLR